MNKDRGGFLQQLSYWINSDQSMGSRSNQEDCFFCSRLDMPLEKGLLMVLCDGMGGMDDGERFATIGVNEMIRHFEQTPPLKNPVHELVNCFQAANKVAVEQQNSDHPGGATVVAVLLRDGCCSFLSVGDSRIYLLRGGGLIQLTRDQVLGDALDERAALGALSISEAKSNIRRNSLINCLGSKSSMECDCCPRPFPLMVGDRLALMSDGVFGTLSETEMQDLLSSPEPDVAQRIIQAVLQKKKPRQDNCSVLLAEARPMPPSFFRSN